MDFETNSFKTLETDDSNDSNKIDTLQKAYDYLIVEKFNLASYPVGEIVLLINSSSSSFPEIRSNIEFSTFLDGVSSAVIHQDFLLYFHLRSQYVLDMKLDYCRIVFPKLSKDFESQICLDGVEREFKFLL